MKFKLLLIIPVLALLASTCKKKEKSRPHLVVESSFEDSDPFDEWISGQYCCDHSLTKSTARFTDGTHSLRMEVRSDDKQTSGSIRSELMQEPDKAGTEKWYGFNMYLEDWMDDNAGETAFAWLPENASGVSTASLWVSGGRYIFQRDPSGSNSGSQYIDIGPILSNQWVSWVIHVKWADDNSGILQVWKNQSLVINLSNIKTSPPEGTFFKLGINKFGWVSGQPSATTKRVIYFDEVRIGDKDATYEGVKPSH